MLLRISKIFLVCFVLCLLITGCHFVGDGSAALGTSGFFAGLWDGSVLVFSVVLTCFTDIQILDLNNNGFLYKLGYAVGTLAFAWNIGLAGGLVSLFLYILPF